MTAKLAAQTARTAVIGIVALMALLLLPAGTLGYWQAWLFIVVFTICTNAIGLYLALRDPALLERRLQFGPGAERGGAQKIISSLIILCVLGLLVFCGFDYRFHWSPVPAWVAVLGDLLIALGLYLTLVVLRVNSYSASNIQVEAGQTVISTGPYAIVRHPMYAGALILMLGVPLALDSWLGLIVVLLMLPVLAWRILDEERILKADLVGYREYSQRVRYRLVPAIW